MGIWNSAVGLLLVTGAFLSVSLPLGKMATAAGVSAPAWSFVISFGAGILLLPALLASSKARLPNAHKLRYFFITAAISYALPNLILFLVIPRLGSGYSGIMFTLSPVITLAMSIALRLRRPNALGITGIGVGFAGAMMVALSRGEAGRPAELVWVAVALVIPVLLASGNIYRTLDWPPESSPLELAVGSHVASALMLLTGMVMIGDGIPVALLGEIPLAVIAQGTAAAVMFVFFFRLQTVGGPVYLSQIGYVAAAIGLVIGTAVFGERYPTVTWLGAAIITIGVLLTTLAQQAEERRQAAG
ncbi:EamA-like transporter family protein [Mesorhizobium sp. J18]|uniref:DMT family transporter n=1 Tax=Mesorhizobium sp. J18 TaxID=935263 RepID=UPI00119B3DA9|nr:DMT family transporter [Mesorhizobium sp. J18]TWG90274.1 EamA-like transporter family protein [Mesorhizobium sp. J18]